MKLRSIELSTYIEETKEDSGASLFVINSMKQRGKLLFSCSGETGATATIKVPDTWVPIDLTTQAQRDKLMVSTQFKDLLRKGALKIVAASVSDVYKAKGFMGAEDALKETDVKEEYENVMASLGTIMNTITSIEDDEAVDLNVGRAGNNAHKSEQKASDIALSLISREEAGEPDNVILNAFRTKMGAFTPDDLRYIATKSKNSKIKELAAELLNADDDLDGEITLR